MAIEKENLQLIPSDKRRLYFIAIDEIDPSLAQKNTESRTSFVIQWPEGNFSPRHSRYTRKFGYVIIRRCVP